MTELDCEQVRSAALAVALHEEPVACGFETVLDPDAPELSCDSPIFFEDFEGDPSSTWSVGNDGVYAEYRPRDWQWTNNVPGNDGSAFFALDGLEVGDCVAGSDDQSGVMHLLSPPIRLPLDREASPLLTFDHWVATEADYDGGNVRISVNGGPFLLVSAEDYVFNGYNGTLESADAASPNTSPLAGQPAFHGADEGSLSGSWGQSRIDLAGIAEAGDTIRIRFDFGVDGCNGNKGWYVDDVRVCSGAPAEPVELFADSFETGDTERWSLTEPGDAEDGAVGPGAVTQGAALVGGFGYELTANGGKGRAFVQTNALENEPETEIRWHLQGRDITFTAGTEVGKRVAIARALSGSDATAGVRWELGLVKVDESGAAQLVFSWFEQNGVKRDRQLAGNVEDRTEIRVSWTAAGTAESSDGSVEVALDGAVVVTEDGLDNHFGLDAFAMGLLKHPQRLATGATLLLDEVTIVRP